MDIHFPTDGVKMTIVRKTIRLVGENTIKHETFGLWEGHIIKLLTSSRSPTKNHNERYITSLNLGDQIEVEGKLQMSLVLKKVISASASTWQEESSSEDKNSNRGEVPAHTRSTETENGRPSRSKPTPRGDGSASHKLTR